MSIESSLFFRINAPFQSQFQNNISNNHILLDDNSSTFGERPTILSGYVQEVKDG
ncbi:MAG: hypothetical protein H5U29_02820 [Pusillimonas sp.]|jgi:hypothetical protein|nr:hypothetical protein [Pusillimonas sp.]